ncbi:MAG: formyltransferase family protein, partial [Sphingobium sp.]
PLPRMRGRAVIPWTILNEEPITGGTLFWIDAGVDSGPILEQRFMHVAPDETADSLYRRHMRLLDLMLDDALRALAAGTPRREPQDERFATWAAGRTPESGRIDWTAPARDVERLVRAAGRPYPGARTRVASSNSDLILWQARLCSPARCHLAAPGQVIARSADSFTIFCGDGEAVEITRWEGAPAPKLHARLGG